MAWNLIARGGLRVITVLLLVMAYPAGLGWAQDKPRIPKTEAAVDTAAITEPMLDDSSHRARIFLDKIEVLGRIAKPQALFIVPGNDPEVEGLLIDRSFFRDIFRPVEWDHLRQRGQQQHRLLAW